MSKSNNVVKKVLPNGLTVLLKEDHSSPVVGINVWFRVGSVNEVEESSGLAHFQEHMVFKGTERHGVGEIANLIKSAGGNLNAATSYSYTMYYVVLPSNAFSLGLDVQADAMMNSTFDPEEFQKERLVVIEEARMYDDTPDSYTFYRTMELGFEVHNYRRPIAGYEHIVKEFTRDQLVDFYNRYYRPGNAVLVVVGDVETEAAMTQIEAVYGTWKNGSIDVEDSPAEPEQTGFRFRALQGSIDHAYLGAGFHVPNILDEDYPALEMLSNLLGSGKSSRLYRRVVEDKHLATTVSADLLAEKWPGYFMFFLSSPADKWAAARDAVFEEVARFQQEPVGEAELLKARRQLEKSMYSGLETVEGQASNLGYYEVLGDYRLADEHREAIRHVTAEEVMYVAKKYFRPETCSMIAYIPEGAGADPRWSEVEEAMSSILTPDGAATITARGSSRRENAARPAAMARTADNVMTLSRLPNGVRVLVKRRSTVPTVAMLTMFQGGTRLETPGQAGLAGLASRTLAKGTESFNAEQIVSTIEGLGGSIDSFSSFDTTGAYVNILSEYLGDAVPVYREVVRRPEFAADVVEKEKAKLLKELSKRHDHPVYVSIDNLFANVYGGHPYAHPFIGDKDQLAKLTPDDCHAWHDKILVPENMVMIFVGDIANERAIEIASELYGDLAGTGAPQSGAEIPSRPHSPGLHELRRPNLKQAVGLVGLLAPPMMTDESVNMTVLNGIMTGLGGRLFVELRDKRSFGYMAGSSFLPLKDRSIFYAYTNPGPEHVDEAFEVILRELERVTREPVTDEELARSKQWLIGSHTMKMQRNGSQAMEYGVYETLGFGYGIVDRFDELIGRVTQESIQRAVAGVFDRRQAVLIKLVPSGSP